MWNLKTPVRGRSSPFGRARGFLCIFWLTSSHVALADEQPPRARTLRLLALVDASYQAAHPAWKPRLERIVATASAELEPRLGLRLVVTEYLPWVYKGPLTNGRQAWQLLSRAPLPSADLVVGFTAAALPKPGPVGRLELGNASAFGRQTLVADSGIDEQLATRVLVHELGHVFGTFHTADPRCIMQPSANLIPNDWQLSPPIEEIWRLTLREFDPRRGVESISPETLQRVAELFARHRRPDESLGDHPVAQGYAYQAVLALTENRRQRARRMARTALDYAPENVAALQVLGEAALREEDWSAAADALGRARALAPDNPEALVGLASAYWRNGQLDLAQEAAQRALAAAPHLPAALSMAAHCARLAGAREEYLRLRTQLERTSPRHARRLAELAGSWSSARYRALCACRRGAERAAADQRENSMGMRFVRIPRPEEPFSWNSNAAAAPRSNESQSGGSQGGDFWLAATEATHDQYRKVMGRLSPGRFAGRGGDHPVEQITWDEAQEFCRRLSDLDAEREAGRHYRLPTEAEWSWACRGDAGTREFFGNQAAWLADYAWLAEGTHRVATKAPSARGLFDMLGNVGEWCQDWYAPLSTTTTIDSQGPATGTRRVVRGGTADATDGPPSGALRQSAPPGVRSAQIGFRVVLILPSTTAP